MIKAVFHTDVIQMKLSGCANTGTCAVMSVSPVKTIKTASDDIAHNMTCSKIVGTHSIDLSRPFSGTS